LAQICMDPYYRTLEGFCILIIKDWLEFGHQFQKRMGFQQDDSVNEEERGPVFEQFIEGVWQLMQQFPTVFEFHETFLIALLDQAYSCRFGTFLGNCPRDRDEYNISQRSLSVFSYLQNCPQHEEFYNVFYSHSEAVVRPQCSSKILKFWNNYYLRCCPEHICSVQPVFLDRNECELKMAESLKIRAALEARLSHFVGEHEEKMN